MDAPRFNIEELWEIEESARSSLLNEDGVLSDPGHWLGLVIDLSRGLRKEVESRVHGPSFELPTDWPSI